MNTPVLTGAAAHNSVLPFLDSLRKEFVPASEHETFLIEQMAHARWKAARFQALEIALFDKLAQDCAPGVDPDTHLLTKLMDNPTATLTLIQRSSAAAERSYYKAHAELMKSRASEARPAAPITLPIPKLQNKPISIPAPEPVTVTTGTFFDNHPLT